jgi:ABC-type dipeptide/oligopeptide/nickel transport system ATPase component
MTDLLNIHNLKVEFDTDEGRILAVDNVILKLQEGQILGLVGESGSGKSVTAKSIMQLNAENAVYGDNSKIVLEGQDVLKFKENQDLKVIRGGKVSMIFQEPMASFAPAITIGEQMVELLLLHKKISKENAKSTSIDMLDRMGIEVDLAFSFEIFLCNNNSSTICSPIVIAGAKLAIGS